MCNFGPLTSRDVQTRNYCVITNLLYSCQITADYIVIPESVLNRPPETPIVHVDITPEVGVKPKTRHKSNF